MPGRLFPTCGSGRSDCADGLLTMGTLPVWPFALPSGLNNKLVPAGLV